MGVYDGSRRRDSSAESPLPVIRWFDGATLHTGCSSVPVSRNPLLLLLLLLDGRLLCPLPLFRSLRRLLLLMSPPVFPLLLLPLLLNPHGWWLRWRLCPDHRRSRGVSRVAGSPDDRIGGWKTDYFRSKTYPDWRQIATQLQDKLHNYVTSAVFGPLLNFRCAILNPLKVEQTDKLYCHVIQLKCLNCWLRGVTESS